MNAESERRGRHRARRAVTRRSLLVGGGIVVVAAGGGVAAGVLRPVRTYRAPRPPAALRAALGAEDTLIAALDAALSSGSAPQQLLGQLRADHVEHRRAIAASITAITREPVPAARSRPPAPGPAPDRSSLRAAEAAAAREGAARATHLHGAHATLLAVVAACEATHAELLR